ncbi:MAG: hypothetical protein ACKVZH_25770 [Blastocatellia bacterium]
MSQEKDTKKDSGEARKKLWLGVLGVVFVLTIYLQFFTGDDPAPKSPSANNSSASRTPAPSPTPRSALKPGEKAIPIVTQPLEFAWFGSRTSGDGTGRNIFVYPTPTPPPAVKPPPPPPPTPPPPIMLSAVSPPGVIGKTGPFQLTVMGDKIPVDAQAFLDGRPYPTRFISQNRIEVQIPGEAIQRGGNMGVQVRSKSDAALYSNQLSINVAEPPPPPYKYVGLITAKSGMTAILKSQADENDVHTVSKGGKVGTHWRIVSINPQRIEIEDTNIKIVHVINYTAETTTN